MKFRLSLLLLIFMQNICYSSETLYKNNEEIEHILNSNPYSPNYLSLFFGLAFVVALIYITGFIYQKLIKVKLSDEENVRNQIKIISSQTLGQNKSLYVIQINDKKLLIGATQNNISYIDTLDNSYNDRGGNDKQS